MDDPWLDFLRGLLMYLGVGVAGIAVAAAVLPLAPYIRRHPLPIPRLRPGWWGGGEVVMSFMSMYVAQTVVVGVFLGNTAPGPDPRLTVGRLLIDTSPLWDMLTLAIVITMLFAISRTRPHQYGVTWARWPANVIFGVVAYLALAPITLGAYLLVSVAFKTEPFFIEQVVKASLEPWEWGLLVFMTVVGAPLTEEILFRGVFQGWLRRASLLGHITVMIVLFAYGAWPLAAHVVAVLLENAGINDRVAGESRSLIQTIGPLVFSTVLVGGYGIWLYRLWCRFHRHTGIAWLWSVDRELPGLRDASHNVHALLAPAIAAHASPEFVQQRRWAFAHLSVYGSAALFSLGHGWPRSVPLMLFALGLGWLALRTQSLIGGMVCHALFNAVACLTLYWKAIN